MEKKNPFKTFLDCQKEKIELDKIKDEIELNKSFNLQEFFIDWIQRNSEWFRRAWDISKCKDCSKTEYCGWKAISACDKFKGDCDEQEKEI